MGRLRCRRVARATGAFCHGNDEPEREASSGDLRVHVVARQQVDREMRLSFVVKNPYAESLGLLVPVAPKSAKDPEFPEFQGAGEAAAPTAAAAVIETRCGPDPRTRLTLEPGQKVARSSAPPLSAPRHHRR